ncbi:RING finger protein 10, partial [Tyrophagus putrescentiae]
HHQRNGGGGRGGGGGGGGREPKQTVLGQQLHFEENQYQHPSAARGGGYLGGRGGRGGRGGFRGAFNPRRNNNHNTAASNMGNITGKVSAKERFIQANSQFVVSPLNDSSKHLKDPDAPINWALVEEVIFSSSGASDEEKSSSSVVCPVCLCAPVAGKVTRCGHIYCWSCILHYLALSDKDSRACPICFETISKDELKSVAIVSHVDYSAADHLTFALMKGEAATVKHRIRRGVHPLLDQFAKVFTASPQYLEALLEREAAELAEQLLEYEREQMPEACFVHEALQELEKRRAAYEALSAQLAFAHQWGAIEASLLADLPRGEPQQESDFNYFYQSEDGQAIYLHPLNIRMLKAEYGELRRCPDRITARIVDLRGGEGVHGPAKERRYVFLRHLPLSAEYKVAEVEFTVKGEEENDDGRNGVLSPATVAEFAPEVAARRKDRKRKEKAQQARDRRIEVENRRLVYGIAAVAPTNFHLDDLVDFPTYLAEMHEFAAGGMVAAALPPDSSSTSSSENGTAELGSSSSPSLAPQPAEPPISTGGSSFAKMLGNGGGAGGTGGPGGNFFDRTLRKKTTAGGQATSGPAAGSGEDDDEAAAAALAMQSMNITLGDFFENCIKTKGGKKGGRKGKK